MRLLICDLDGVVRHYDPRLQAEIEARHGLATGEIAAEAFGSPLLSKAVTGLVSDAEWREAIAVVLEARHGEPGRAAVMEWSLLLPTVEPTVLGLLAQVRRRLPVVALTNATDRLASDMTALGLSDTFDAVVNSSELGLAKPDPLAFAAALAVGEGLIGSELAPHEVVFIDDAPGHVSAATALGWTGHVYIEVEALDAFLNGLSPAS